MTDIRAKRYRVIFSVPKRERHRARITRRYNRKPREVSGKDTTDYDAVAIEQLKRLHERRRRIKADAAERAT